MFARLSMTEPSPRRLTLGILLALAVALSFACNTALASVAYRNGASALSVLTYRTLLATAALFVILKVAGVPMTLSPRKRWIAWALGVLLGTYSYGLLGAIQYMPLALAVLTFYLWPLIMGVAAASLGMERMTPALGVALVVAFAGLVLALDVQAGTLSPIGVALAASGAVLNVVMMLANRKLVGAQQDSRPVTLHMLMTGSLTYIVACLVWGDFPLPQSGLGWTAFLGVGVFYSFSIICVYISLSIIGPMRAGLFANFEPIASVFIGTVILGQAMKISQLLGAALVLGAIIFTAWNKNRGLAAR
jgi:drug/metabolite transporter (DMT)-like permease